VAARWDYHVALTADAGMLTTSGNGIHLFELMKEAALATNTPEPADAWNAPWKQVAPGTKPPMSEKLTAAAERYQAILKELNALSDQAEKEFIDATTEESQRQVMKKVRKHIHVFARRFLELAEKYPEDAAAVDALTEVVSTMQYGPEADKAAEILARRYLGHEKIAKYFERLTAGTHAPPAQALLRAFAERGATTEVRAVASFKLAKSLLSVAETADKLRADKSGAFAQQFEQNSPLGDEFVKHLRGEDSKKLTAEGEKILREIIAKHAKVQHPYMRGTLGEAAEWELEELQNPKFAVGRPAPEIEGKDVDGKSFKLSDYRGKVVLLTFSGNWCLPCRAMYPHERALVERMKKKPFVALSVNTDQERETLEKSIRKGEITWRCWWDEKVGPISTAWRIEGFPAVFVLDAKGIIRFKRLQGEALDQAVESLLNE
jgi:peroxiredoxin